MKFYQITSLSFCIILSLSQLAQGQSQPTLDDVRGVTTPKDIVILSDFSETKDLHKLGEAHSKARGVTYFSAMNAMNSRAKRKLLEEASIRGASHVWITQRMPYGGIQKFFSYQANLYQSDENTLTEADVRKALENNTFTHRKTISSNRNAFKSKTRFISSDKVLTLHAGSEIFSNEKGVFVTITYPKGTKVFRTDYQIVGIHKNIIVLVEEIKADKRYAAHQLWGK
jgi:hypothetical protein